MYHDTHNNENVQLNDQGADIPEEDEQLGQQLEAARMQATENWNKYLRSVADMDNYRKRQERTIADRLAQQKKSLLQNILAVMDTLDRALAYQESLDRDAAIQTLKLIASQLTDIMKAEGVQSIVTLEQPFDPYMHEAVELIPTSQYPEGVVLEETLKGYTIDDTLLRHARVKVSKKSAAEGMPQETE